uniref:WD repeat and FYVE domain-containing protein 3 n=1 Tax=Aceria tosichella TaxID=561515 RepID=A0A6G1S8Q5_9ACAR
MAKRLTETAGQQQHEGDDTSNELVTHEFTSTALIKAFTQLLVQLSSYQAGIDELIKKDDLRLLIGIASNQCAPQNRAWRKTAFLALLAISKNMRDNFIYLEQNICIQVYVENMHRINSLGLATMEDLIDMIRVVIVFFYNLDVNNRNQLPILMQKDKIDQYQERLEVLYLLLEASQYLLLAGLNILNFDTHAPSANIILRRSTISQDGVSP